MDNNTNNAKSSRSVSGVALVLCAIIFAIPFYYETFFSPQAYNTVDYEEIIENAVYDICESIEGSKDRYIPLGTVGGDSALYIDTRSGDVVSVVRDVYNPGDPAANILKPVVSYKIKIAQASK